jgi:hypothetical protein
MKLQYESQISSINFLTMKSPIQQMILKSAKKKMRQGILVLLAIDMLICAFIIAFGISAISENPMNLLLILGFLLAFSLFFLGLFSMVTKT